LEKKKSEDLLVLKKVLLVYSFVVALLAFVLVVRNKKRTTQTQHHTQKKNAKRVYIFICRCLSLSRLERQKSGANLGERECGGAPPLLFSSLLFFLCCLTCQANKKRNKKKDLTLTILCPQKKGKQKNTHDASSLSKKTQRDFVFFVEKYI
jgi:preprotein translocase subunit SecG